MTGYLTDNELYLVSEIIASRTGLYFPKERWGALGKNLTAAAREFGYRNINEFVQWLLFAPVSKEQIKIIAACLTVSETYFWRESQVFSALTGSILPGIMKPGKKKDKRLRIWSAGCSTGEEPYSIAIAIHKTIPDIRDWNISILATDINEKSLTKARSGIYNPWSFRNSPDWLKETYFRYNQNQKYEIIPEIKKMVTFSCYNLAQEDCWSEIHKAGPVDIIFCRNVLMYFTHECAEKISCKLSDLLSKKGFLVVSSCELSSKLFPKLTAVNFPGAVVYRRTLIKPGPEYSLPPEQIKTSNLYSAKSGQRQTSTLQSISAVPDLSHQLQSVPESQHDSFRDKINAIRLLANQNQLTEALTACDKALVLLKLEPGLHLLRASILQEMNRGQEAIRSLKKAIYIDPDYIMGHFTLGNLYFHQGNLKNAERYFNNTLELLNFRSNDEIPEESEGLSVKFIKEIILANLHIPQYK